MSAGLVALGATLAVCALVITWTIRGAWELRQIRRAYDRSGVEGALARVDSLRADRWPCWFSPLGCR